MLTLIDVRFFFKEIELVGCASRTVGNVFMVCEAHPTTANDHSFQKTPRMP
jgi:hypothetical protein